MDTHATTLTRVITHKGESSLSCGEDCQANSAKACSWLLCALKRGFHKMQRCKDHDHARYCRTTLYFYRN